MKCIWHSQLCLKVVSSLEAPPTLDTHSHFHFSALMRKWNWKFGRVTSLTAPGGLKAAVRTHHMSPSSHPHTLRSPTPLYTSHIHCYTSSVPVMPWGCLTQFGMKQALWSSTLQTGRSEHLHMHYWTHTRTHRWTQMNTCAPVQMCTHIDTSKYVSPSQSFSVQVCRYPPELNEA